MPPVLLQNFDSSSERAKPRPIEKRLLSVARQNVPLRRHEDARPLARKSTRIEPVAVVLLAVALHLLAMWAVWQRGGSPPVVKAPQEIELIRPLQIKPEPPKPVTPPRTPTKVVAPARPAPPVAALRTAAATTDVVPTNAVTIPQNLSAEKTTGPVVAAPPAPKVEEPVTEANAFAGYLNNPPPVYPRSAQRLGVQGRVLLRVHVLASGRVSQVELKQSSGKSVLDEAALIAVRDWTFAPAKRGRTAIDGWATVPIDFKLAS